MTKVKFREWEFEVDRELTIETYQKESSGGAEGCKCCDCKNYVAYRNNVFPAEILQLFADLGIDFRKEVEVFSNNIFTNGLQDISGWFHFKGQILSGKNCEIPFPSGGYDLDMTTVTSNFTIGFTENSSLTFFEDKTGLVEVIFTTNIPWPIDKSVE